MESQHSVLSFFIHNAVDVRQYSLSQTVLLDKFGSTVSVLLHSFQVPLQENGWGSAVIQPVVGGLAARASAIGHWGQRLHHTILNDFVIFAQHFLVRFVTYLLYRIRV